MGVLLSKDLVKMASRTMVRNLAALGPLVLPPSEKCIFALNLVYRKYLASRKVPSYTPDFTRAVDHFCLHAGRALRSPLTHHPRTCCTLSGLEERPGSDRRLCFGR